MSKPVQVACYKHGGHTIAQKVRFPGKDFVVLGDAKNMGLYGQHLWRDSGKMVVITEGEIDAISLSQVQGHKWPVVSIPQGAPSARKAIEQASEWLEKFERVVFMFDNDEPGRQAAVAAAMILTPGKAFIAELPLKDANDMLRAGRSDELRNAIWAAKPYRPDGIVDGSDITPATLRTKAKPGLWLPWKKLQEMTHGIRASEVVLFTAGTGAGKTTAARELAVHLVREHGQKVGNIFLEESFEKTAQGYVAIDNDLPLGAIRENPGLLSDEQVNKSLAEIIHGRMWFYDHFGSMESETLLAKMKFMAKGLGCNWIILDHISIVVSGMESSGEGERKDIDILMTRLRSLTQETGVGVIAIVHLSQPKGEAHEEGAEVSLNQLRGSGSLKHIPDTIVAFERDQQGKDPCLAHVRLLKNREWSVTGSAGYVRYDLRTGRLKHTDEDPSIEFGNETEPPVQAGKGDF